MGFSRRYFYFGALIPLVVIGLALKSYLTGNGATQSSIRIDSFPRSTIFINDKYVGQTPYTNEKISAGQYTVRLDPMAQPGETLGQWQAKIKLTAGTLTYVSRDIGASEEQSAGQILTLEPLSSDKDTELAVVSTPDKAKIFLDGLDQGSAPLVLRNMKAGDHEITISAGGFSDQIVHGKIVSGYRLNAIVQLGVASGGSTSTQSAQLRPTSDLIASISGSQITRPYVVIKDTPTGFLRTRSDPSPNATEVGQVKPSEKYPLLSETDGWVKIKLPNIFGWVSDQYVEKVK